MSRLVPLLGLVLLFACKGSASKDVADSVSDSITPDGDSDTDADSDADVDTGEEEEDLLRLPPAQTDQYVFVANPERDTVTRVQSIGAWGLRK